MQILSDGRFAENEAARRDKVTALEVQVQVDHYVGEATCEVCAARFLHRHDTARVTYHTKIEGECPLCFGSGPSKAVGDDFDPATEFDDNGYVILDRGIKGPYLEAVEAFEGTIDVACSRWDNTCGCRYRVDACDMEVQGVMYPECDNYYDADIVVTCPNCSSDTRILELEKRAREIKDANRPAISRTC